MKITLSFDGLNPLEANAIEAELANLFETNVKALRTRDPAQVDAFLISLGANAVSALTAIIIRQLKKKPNSRKKTVKIEMRVRGQHLKFESTDPSLNEQLVKKQVANILLEQGFE